MMFMHVQGIDEELNESRDVWILVEHLNATKSTTIRCPPLARSFVAKAGDFESVPVYVTMVNNSGLFC
jgi:hypothetical protein